MKNRLSLCIAAVLTMVFLCRVLPCRAASLVAQANQAIEQAITAAEIQWIYTFIIAWTEQDADDPRSVIVKGKSPDPELIAAVLAAARSVDGIERVTDAIVRLPHPDLKENVHGIVKVPVSTAYAKSNWQDNFTAPEVISQSIMGTEVDILEQENDCYRGRMPDGFLGWMETQCIVALDDLALADWHAGKRVTLEPVITAVYSATGVPLFNLSMGTELPLLAIEGERARVRLPDGRAGLLPSADVKVWQSHAEVFAPPLAWPEIEQLARRLVGIPYKWGGSSCYGFDCSGFTQFVYRLAGRDLPRNTRYMSEQSEPLAKIAELRAGDLVFFGPGYIDHVGIYIGDGEYLNSRNGTGVVVDSFNASAPNYDPEGRKTFMRGGRLAGIGDSGN